MTAPPLRKQLSNHNRIAGNYDYYSASSQYPNAYGIGKNKAIGKAVKADRGRGLNVLTVNGAYQPIVRVQSDTWQRWRILYSGIKVRRGWGLGGWGGG